MSSAPAVSDTRPGTGSQPAAPVYRLARLVFALLVVGCFVAFFATYRLKHTPTAVQQIKMLPVFSPTAFGRHKVERVSFKIARADEATVEVFSATTGDYVASLAVDRPLVRYHKTDFFWNGRTGANQRGPVATGGYYRVRIILRNQRRTVNSQREFCLTLHRGEPACT